MHETRHYVLDLPLQSLAKIPFQIVGRQVSFAEERHGTEAASCEIAVNVLRPGDHYGPRISNVEYDLSNSVLSQYGDEGCARLQMFARHNVPLREPAEIGVTK